MMTDCRFERNITHIVLSCFIFFQLIVVVCSQTRSNEIYNVTVQNLGEVIKLECDKFSGTASALINPIASGSDRVLGYAWQNDLGHILSTKRDVEIEVSEESLKRVFSCVALVLSNGRHQANHQRYRLSLSSSQSASPSDNADRNKDFDRIQRSYDQHQVDITGPQYPADYSEKSQVRLTCNVRPNLEQTTYTWFTIPQLSQGNNLRNLGEEIGSGMDIEVVPSYNANYYRCEVRGYSYQEDRYVTINGEYTLQPIRGSQNIPSKRLQYEKSEETTIFEVQIITDKVEPEFDKSLLLTCQVHPEIDNLEYKWSLDERIIGSEKNFLIPRFNINNTKIFTCMVTGFYKGLRLQMSSSRRITPRIHESRIIKMGHKEPEEFISDYEGSSKELHCEGEGANIASLNPVWYLNDRQIDPQQTNLDSVFITNRMQVSILTIEKLSDRNGGKYQCRINGYINGVVIFPIKKITIVDANPKSVVISAGKKVEIHCIQMENGRTDSESITWYYSKSLNGPRSPLIRDWKIAPISAESKAIFIELDNSMSQHSGFYECVSRDNVRSVSQLIVVENKEIEVNVSPQELSVRPGNKFEINCLTKNRGVMYGEPNWFVDRSSSLEDRFPSNMFTVQYIQPGVSKLIFPRGLSDPNREFVFVCRLEDKDASARVKIEDICPVNHRRCRNGQCIPSSKFCDNINDCEDGSDEKADFCEQCDPLEVRCREWQGRQPINKIIMVHWKCDGEDDCGNGYDEMDCRESSSYEYRDRESCGGSYYRCPSSGINIPKAFHCDKERDCLNNDDETNCRLPIFQRTEGGQMDKRRGENVTLVCRVTGTPLPTVVWRYNWGCVPQPRDGRIRIVTENEGCTQVVSTLTISAFSPGDDGIYNCEALVGSERIMSPDFSLALSYL